VSEFINKIALVTGAGAGIGRATAVALSVKGAKVVVTDYKETSGKQTVEEIISKGGNAVFYKLDVSSSEEIKSVTSTIFKNEGSIDYAVNNAGIGGNLAGIHTLDVKDWNKTINVNLTGVFSCLQAQIKCMLKKGFGRIVNVASMAGTKGVGGGSAYSASKHGVLGLTKSAAIEYGAHNIRVNAVCPGFIETDMIKAVPKKILDFNTLVNPMKRLGNTKEVADTIVWLLCDESSFVNGTSMSIDGGYGNV
jgi:NAD(P)-dependent dehydrogenase (short-subunit alcohol dehydrogenase family)